MPAPNHYISLKNGKFDTDTPAENLAAIFENLQSEKYNGKPLVIHFHGGLVNKNSGIEIANTLRPRYATENDICYPLFFVWESGLIEVIAHNIPEILSEDLFKRVLKLVKKYVASKIDQELFGDAKGGEIAILGDHEVDAKLHPDLSQLPATTSLDKDQQNQLYELLSNDEQLENILAGILMEEGGETSKGLAATPVKSMISKSFLDEIKSEVKFEADAKGPLAIGKILWAIVKIAVVVIKRCADKTDHGIYVTIMEEILRKIYIDKIGGEVWAQMKKDTGDAFGDDEEHGGRMLLKKIAENHDPANPRRIILIGHSTGAVYICNLLRFADEYKLDANIKFDVVFLAPACTFKLLSDTLSKHEKRVNNIISFGMKDEVERADHMVPVLYPHSLLYFVSGLLERDENEESFIDMPIVGMERYYKKDNAHAKRQEVIHVRNVLSGKQIWSIDNQGNGKYSSSEKHGDFDNDVPTLDSIVYIISNP